MKYTLEERLDTSRRLRKEGYNCAQSVIMVFDDVTGLDRATAAKISSALGSGVAGCGEICGVANAIALTIGMLHGSEPSDKISALKEARPLIDEFARSNGGCLACRDLKGKKDIAPCDELVFRGVEILDRHFRNP